MLEKLSLIEEYEHQFEKINNQRHYWLWASSFVFCFLIFLIFGWDWLDGLKSKSIWWLIVSLMILISINWWYWTMRVIRKIINYQLLEYHFLRDIAKELILFKQDLQRFKQEHEDQFDKE